LGNIVRKSFRVEQVKA